MIIQHEVHNAPIQSDFVAIAELHVGTNALSDVLYAHVPIVAPYKVLAQVCQGICCEMNFGATQSIRT
eukprot:SAG31_NODE_4393_length_3273_cov_2.562067_4_plen_68_part_00